MGVGTATILLCALGALLVWAGIEDVRRREIANWKNGAIALLAPAWWWAIGLPLWPGIALQLGIAVAVFAFFAAAFCLGQMGGGDVKMIGALALWLPLGALAGMLVAMALIGGVLTVLLLAECRWRRESGSPEIPYGVAIALAGLLTLREPIINQFG